MDDNQLIFRNVVVVALGVVLIIGGIIASIVIGKQQSIVKMEACIAAGGTWYDYDQNCQSPGNPLED